MKFSLEPAGRFQLTSLSTRRGFLFSRWKQAPFAKVCNSYCFWPQYIVLQPHWMLQTLSVPTSMPWWQKCVANSKLQLDVFKIELKRCLWKKHVSWWKQSVSFLLCFPLPHLSQRRNSTVFLNILIRGPDTIRCFFFQKMNWKRKYWKKKKPKCFQSSLSTNKFFYSS